MACSVSAWTSTLSTYSWPMYRMRVPNFWVASCGVMLSGASVWACEEAGVSIAMSNAQTGRREVQKEEVMGP